MTKEFIHTILPVVPAPKQVTARAPIKSLGENYLAFLAAHNKQGYVETFNGAEISILFEFAKMVQGKTNICHNEAKTMAGALHMLLKETNVDRSKCNDIVATMAGYKSWSHFPEGLKSKHQPFPVRNFRYVDHDAEVTVDNAKGVISKFIEEKKTEVIERGVKNDLAKDQLRALRNGNIDILLTAIAQSSRPWLLDVLKEYQTNPTANAKIVTSTTRYLWKYTDIYKNNSRNIVAMVLGYRTYEDMAQANPGETIVVLPPLIKFP